MFGLSWLSPTILGAVGIALIASLAGGWTAHKLDQIPLSRSQAETAAAKADLASYKGAVAASVAKADAKALEDKQAQDATANALQAKLIQTQKVADDKSAQLRAILNKAAPGDIRPLGPNALNYLAELRRAGTKPTPATP